MRKIGAMFAPAPFLAVLLGACHGPGAALPEPGPPQAAAQERARLGVAQVRTLESFALELKARLGGADDGPVFAAANRAIVAASHTGGLAVALPMGRVEHTSAGLLLDNNGGYFCPAPGQCTVQAVRAGASSAASWLVTVNDPYATNLVLSGITFYGGWSWSRAPYAAAPESDPWLDKQGGVNITHAFQGATDPMFIANSRTGSQLPADHIENLVVSGFGGDCLLVQGAGQNSYQNIRGVNCGGHGARINSYDNKFSGIDFGGTGRACLFLDGQGASNNIQGKVWYCGFRLKPGDDEGARLDASGNMIDMIVQDSYGDAIANASELNMIKAIVAWQGQIDKMDPGPIAAYSCIGCAHNIVTIDAAILANNQAAYPNITRLYRDLPKGGRYGHDNIIRIQETGWPQDYGLWQPFWFEGPLDASNHISLNGIERLDHQQPGPDGRLAYAAGMNGSAAGTVVFGAGSDSPGKVAVICQGAGNTACVLQGYRNTAGFAAAVLTSRGNYAPGDTVAIGGAVYTFDALLRALPGHVHLGADEGASLDNLAHAINAAGGTPGTDYAGVTVPNPAVTAARSGAHALTVTARTAGTGGDGVAVSAKTARAAWNAATLQGGAAGQQTYAAALTWDKDGHPGMPSLPGPYANDAAARAAGVPLGNLYRDAASVVHVRAS